MSQFEDLQQCYLRLRKSGRSLAGSVALPVSPFQQAALASPDGDEQPRKRIKQEPQPQLQEQQSQLQLPADSAATLDPLKGGSGAEAGVSPAESPAAAAAAASQVCCLLGLPVQHEWQCAAF